LILPLTLLMHTCACVRRLWPCTHMFDPTHACHGPENPSYLS